MIYEAEEFEVSDVAAFTQAFDGFRAALEAGGGSHARLYRHTETPNRVLATIRWPDIDACHRFAREHEAEFQSAFGPLIVAGEPSQLWEEL